MAGIGKSVSESFRLLPPSDFSSLTAIVTLTVRMGPCLAVVVVGKDEFHPASRQNFALTEAGHPDSTRDHRIVCMVNRILGIAAAVTEQEVQQGELVYA